MALLETSINIKAGRGQALVEFALVAPLLLTFLLGGLDITVFQWKKLVATQAAYVGAQVASQQYEDDDLEVIDEIQALASFIAADEVAIDRNASMLAPGDSVAINIQVSGPWSPQLLGYPRPIVECQARLLKEERELE